MLGFGLGRRWRAGLLVCGEQCFETLTQGRFAGASLFEKSLPRGGRRQFDRGAKQRFLTFSWRWHG